ILCANAGTATFGPVSGLDPASEKAQVQLNALAVHDLTLAVLPGMIERKAGGILISGSAAGNSPIPYNATYAATKAFANTFSESLRGELRGSGVHVTLLAPGPVRTELPDQAEASLVERLVPDFLWISTEHTARISLDALERNKMRVVPGLTSKAMSVASGYAPRAIVAPIVGAFYKKLGGGYPLLLAPSAASKHAAHRFAYRGVDAAFHRRVLQHFLPHGGALWLGGRRHRRQLRIGRQGRVSGRGQARRARLGLV